MGAFSMFVSIGYQYDTAMYGEGSGPILLSNVSCNGSESQLLDCPYEAPDSNCDHSLDAGIYCSTCESILSLGRIIDVMS